MHLYHIYLCQVCHFFLVFHFLLFDCVKNRTTLPNKVKWSTIQGYRGVILTPDQFTQRTQYLLTVLVDLQDK